jgi:hypothetical protein
MSIALDHRTFGRLLDIVMPDTIPSPAEARVILQIAQLAAGIDLDEDGDERGLLGVLTRQLCAIVGIPSSSVRVLSPLPIDAEERDAQIASLATQLATTSARELAYLVAYLLIVSDLELAPVETELLDGLQRALWIEGPRASELAAEVSELVTPGASRELEGAPANP